MEPINDKEKNAPAVPPLVAHRGASYAAPENTLASYRMAWREGADRIEGDFWLTADERIVCLHDPTTERTAPGQKVADVRSTPYAELRKYDVGRWKSRNFTGTAIPALEEILREMPEGTQIYIEIKQDTPRIVEVLLQVVAASPVSLDQVMLISFSAAIVRQVKETVPALRVLLLYDLEDPASEYGAVSSLSELLALARSIKADGLGLGNSRLIDENLVRGIREAHLQFHVWTVNDVEDAFRYIALGVDSITTDRPAGLREEIVAGLGRSRRQDQAG
jgi:glycerophosphoryl diester phosphodiesterase